MYGEDVDLEGLLKYDHADQFSVVGDIFGVHELVKRTEDADVVSGVPNGANTKRKGSKKYDNLDSDEEPTGNGVVMRDGEDDLG